VVAASDRPLIWRACFFMMPLVLVGSLATRNWSNFAATVVLLAVAWAYSVPPVRLKERPPLDSLANGVGYFQAPFAMGYSLHGDLTNLPLKYYLLALAVCGIHALATAADYDADRAAGHRTFATAFGRRAAAGFALATFVAAAALGDYHGVAVWVFLIVGIVATFAATLVPRDWPIAIACVTMFVGFLVAAVCHVAGW
jgi:4-hydroxybenzoate polyprenyltransferase